MTRAEAFSLVDELYATGQSIRGYAHAHGVKTSTLISRAHRAGVRVGVEIRRRRVECVYVLKAQHPEWSWSRAATEAGFTEAQLFFRMRARLASRWGVTLTTPPDITQDERLGRVLSQARRLAEVAELLLQDRSFLGLRIALTEFRQAEQLLERAS